MKAVYVHKNSILRDSHIDPHDEGNGWQLMPATLEAMRLLARDDTLVFVYGPAVADEGSASFRPEGDETMRALVDQVRAGGGRIDAVVACYHAEGASCGCWGEVPLVLWLPAKKFGLDMAECYVLGDEERDIAAAYQVSARPLAVLCSRSIADALGNCPMHKDFPIAVDLTMAVDCITVEEEISRQLGHPRGPSPAMPADELLCADAGRLPEMTLTSPLAESLRASAMRTQAQLRDLVRWLTFFTLGALGLSLGVAYLLTHLYRVQPFPQFVYYLTLQFIPRPLRGALFVAWGIGVIVVAVRSFNRSLALRRRV